MVNTWPTAEENGSAAYAYGAWINSCVHVIMYFYYGLTALGIKPPFKKAVTTVQLTQFASCIFMAFAALYLDSTPIFYNAIQVRARDTHTQRTHAQAARRRALERLERLCLFCHEPVARALD